MKLFPSMPFPALLAMAISLPASLSSTTPATAFSLERGQEGRLAEILPPTYDPKSVPTICLARTYDEAHLRRNPQQRVTAVRFWMAHAEVMRPPQLPKAWFYSGLVGVRLKGRKGEAYLAGDCVPAKDRPGAYCLFGCLDAYLEPLAESGGLRITFEEIGRALSPVGSRCRPDDLGELLQPHAENTRFVLYKARASACKSMLEGD